MCAPLVIAPGACNESSMTEPKATRTTEHRVTPSDLQKILAGEGGVDLTSVIKDGKQVAMRVVGVKPGTTAARLGAANDDTIVSINDVPLTSVAAAYQAADLAIQQQRIVIRGTRDGEPYVTILVVERS
jgi:S1-C subfamily serine protease